MNLKQIEYLVAVVNNGSFSLAAKECYVTVQAVSKAIADLERELGLDLFVRESRGVRPTEFGTAFYEKSLGALRAFDELASLPQTYAARSKARQNVLLPLYSPHFNNSDRVLAMLEQFIGFQLGVEVDIPLCSDISVLQKLRDHEIDAFASLGTFSAADDVDCVPIGTLPCAVVVLNGHPLAEKSFVTLEDLSQYPVIKAAQFDSFNDSTLAAYLNAGLASPVVEIHSRKEYDEVAAQRNCYSFSLKIPAINVEYPGYTMVPVAPQDVIPTPICLVSLKTGKTKSYLALEELFKKGLKL